MTALPAGDVTFLFTDLEDSTPLYERLGARYEVMLRRHLELLRAAVSGHGGVEVKSTGDGLFAAFSRPADAVLAAIDMQARMADEPWDDDARPRVRIGLHRDSARPIDGDYVALGVHAAARVMSAAHGGQVFASETTWHAAAPALPQQALARNLGAHRLKGLEAPIGLVQIDDPARPGPVRSPRVGAEPEHNLPSWRTTFVGREVEAAKVSSLLAAAGLVTVVGPGGTGKTRLAAEVGHERWTDFALGCRFVDLTTITEPAHVAHYLAVTLGAEPEADGDAVAALRRFAAGSQSVLVILDNCEHVVETIAELTEIVLRSGVAVTVLATSRQPLGLADERVVRLGPIAADRAGPDAAVQLFVDRAASAAPDTMIDDFDAVARICDQAERMPLAIELAAARLATMSLTDLSAALNDRLDVLRTARRGSTRRQDALVNLIAWSHDLLDSAEQIVFRRLAVFVAGFPLEAATTVVVAPDASVGAAEASDVIASLVEKSLLIADISESTTYRMLESIREFAMRELLKSGEHDAVAACHGAWYARLGDTANDQRLPLNDVENVRAALAHASGAEHARLALALTRAWDVSNVEKIERLESALPGVGATGLAPRVLLSLCRAYESSGRRKDAIDAAGRAIDAAGALGDLHGLGAARVTLAELLLAGGDLAECQNELRRAREIHDVTHNPELFGALLGVESELARTSGDLEGSRALAEECIVRYPGTELEMRGLMRRGIVEAIEGDYAAASRSLSAALELAQTLGLDRATATAQANLANVMRLAGDLDKARDLYAVVADQYLAFGVPTGVASTMHNLGLVAVSEGQFDRAVAYFREAIVMWHELDVPFEMVNSAEELAGAHAQAGRSSEATTLYAAAQRGREQLGTPMVEDRERHEKLMAEARTKLGADADDLWRRGREVDLAGLAALATAGSSDGE